MQFRASPNWKSPDASISLHKSLAISTCFATLILIPEFAVSADASACYSISDSDARAYCLARVQRQPGQCYSIQNLDIRSMCLAEVRK